MTGCTRAGDFASWWHGIVGGAEKLVTLERWLHCWWRKLLAALESW